MVMVLKLLMMDLTRILDDLLNLGGLPLLAADLVLQLPYLCLKVLRLLVQLRPRLDGDCLPCRQPRLRLHSSSLCQQADTLQMMVKMNIYLLTLLNESQIICLQFAEEVQQLRWLLGKNIYYVDLCRYFFSAHIYFSN